MKAFGRLLVTFLTFVASFYFMLWMPFWLAVPLPARIWLQLVAALAAAGIAARFVWKRLGAGAGDSSVLTYAAMGALVVGGVAFCAGFFGPMIFTPGANQGPLLGLLITGPLGVLAGAIGGGIYGAMRGRKKAPAAMAALALLGCAPHGASTNAAAPPAPPALVGSAWTLQGDGGQTIEFPELGRVAGSGGCNKFMGPVEVTGTSIRFGALAATKMACPGEKDAKEAEFFKALGAAERFAVDGDTLSIYVKGSDTPLRFARKVL